MRLVTVVSLIIIFLLGVSCRETSRKAINADSPELIQMKEEAEAFLLLSELHFASGYRKYGLENLKRAYMKNPYDQKSFQRVTKILEEEEDWETLSDYFTYAIEKRRGTDLHFRNLGVCYYKLGEFHKAANSFKQAISRNSMNPETYTYLALTYEKMNKPDDALSTWELLLIILNRRPDLPGAQDYRQTAEMNKEKLERMMRIPVSPK